MRYIFSAEKLEQIRRTFAYDPATGAFSRLDGKNRCRPRTSTVVRYPQINVGGVIYYCHIVAWWMMTDGPVPDGFEIDHRDRDKRNCKWSNLRLLRSSEQKHNTALRCDNKTGVKGLVATKSGTWAAQLKIKNRNMWLGTFKTFEEARDARLAAEIRYFGMALDELHNPNLPN